jgi:peptidyl-prolyl cis-trans isomerase C
MEIKMRKTLSLALVAALLTATSHAEVVGRSIATVNGEAIFLGDFEKNWETVMEQRKQAAPDEPVTPEWEKTQKKALLDQMIEEKLLTQEAKSRNIKVQKRQLEEGILQVKNRFKARNPASKPTKEEFERPLTAKETEEFQKELKSQGLTEKEFNDKIESQLKVMNLTDEEVKRRIPSPVKEAAVEGKEPQLTPEYEKETKDLYTQIEKKYNQKDFKADADNEVDQMVELLKSRLGETVRARHILVKSSRTDDMKTRAAALEKIKAIKKELEDGADFEELARKKSDGPGATNGGDLGFFTRGQMVPEFDKAAFTLPVGGISDVIETQFGYHILKVEEKKAPQKLRYEDIKLDLANYLYQKRGQKRYDDFVAELRKKADVKILYSFDDAKKG